MKKGDLKKQEIIRTAEALFCRKGYEATGVQDILDELHASKGSFYHHFVSKEALLEAILSGRAAQALEAVLAEETEETPIARLNRLLCGLIPLKQDQLSFLMMLLPVFARPEGRSVKNAYCDALLRAFLPSVSEAVAAAAQAGDLPARDSGLQAEICLALINRLWVKICEMMIEKAKTGSETDPADLLHLADGYRTAVENVLTAPFGSLPVIRLADLKLLSDQILIHWKES